MDVLGSGSPEQKIAALGGLCDADSPGVLGAIISGLDDESIRVRGEAFSILLLNGNDISAHLIAALQSPSRNVRGFAALALANRGDASAIPGIARLAGDASAMVRSCALGALGHLGAAGAGDVLLGALADPSLEVRKSALHALASLRIPVPAGALAAAQEGCDGELARMISAAKKC